MPTVAEPADGHAHPPAIVLYLVNPFLCGGGGGGGGRADGEAEPDGVWLLGLLRCYAEMVRELPESLQAALVLQVYCTYSPICVQAAVCMWLWPSCTVLSFFCPPRRPQVVPCQYLLRPASGESPLYLQHLRSLAFSTYSQCRRLLPMQTHIKSLTGFGPASAVNGVLRNPEV